MTRQTLRGHQRRRPATWATATPTSWPGGSPGIVTGLPAGRRRHRPGGSRSTASTTTPVVLLYGAAAGVPGARRRAPTGPDVRQLEAEPAGARLHAGSPWTTTYTAATATAVKALAEGPGPDRRPARSTGPGACSPPARSGSTSVTAARRRATGERARRAAPTPAPAGRSPSSSTSPTSGWPARAPTVQSRCPTASTVAGPDRPGRTRWSQPASDARRPARDEGRGHRRADRPERPPPGSTGRRSTSSSPPPSARTC